MPSSIPELLAILELERLDLDLFRGRQPDTTLQRVFGGQVAAQALRAVFQTVDDDRRVHSLHSYFLLPGDPAVPIIYDVERLRDGRSFSTRRVVARQHGREIFFLTASFQVAEEGFDHADPMPSVSPPEDSPTMSSVIGRLRGGTDDAAWRREWSALDIRYAGDSRPGGSLDGAEHPARAQIWFRAAGEVPTDAETNACVLTYISDLTLLGVSLVPHGTVIGGPDVRAASLDHAMWFHRPFQADRWMLYDQTAPSASGGRGYAQGRVFAADGRLVASVTQEGLIRRQRGA